jgi:Conjugal transfer protein TraD
MAGFDEASMERLAELTAKAKAGTKLTAAEALEVKELKLQKSMAEIAKDRAQIAVARRKIEDREKYRLGGLALAAKLNGWPEDALKGGFAMLAAMSEAEKTALAEHGRQLASAAPTRPLLQLCVSFVEPPGEAITTALKKRGFKWNGTSWDGAGDLADVRGEAELAGGRVEVVGA